MYRALDLQYINVFETGLASEVTSVNNKIQELKL